MRMARVVAGLVLVGALCCPAAELPGAPAAGLCVDAAGLLNDADKQEVERVGAALLAAKGLPLGVVTIGALKDYGFSSIEKFSSKLLETWEAGDRSRDWPRGAVVVVSKSDRKVRIEMGVTYRHAHDAACDKIMSERIVSRFKAGDFSGGVRGGVGALAQLMEKGTLPVDVQPAEAPQVSSDVGVDAVGPDAARAKAAKDDPANFWIGLVFLGFMLALGLFLLWVIFRIVRGVFGWIASRPSSTSDGNSTSSSSSGYSSRSSSGSSSSSSSSSGGGGSTGSW